MHFRIIKSIKHHKHLFMFHAARYLTTSQQLKETSFYFTFTKLSSLLPLVSVTCLEYIYFPVYINVSNYIPIYNTRIDRSYTGQCSSVFSCISRIYRFAGKSTLWISIYFASCMVFHKT